MKIVKFGPSSPGGAGTDPMPIKWQFDVASVARTSAGNYIVNFATPFSSADSYACTVTAHTGSNGASIAYGSGYPTTASSFRVSALTPNGQAFVDPYFDIEVICAGN